MARVLFWVVFLAGSASLGWFLWQSPETQPIARAISPDDTGFSRRAVAAAELEVEPVFLIDRRTRLPAVDEFWAMVDYPVFVPGRSSIVVMPEPEMADFTPAVLEEIKGEPSIRLVGTVVRDNQAMALITDDTNSFLQPVRVGQLIDGWEVEKIDNEQMTLTSGDERLVFSILAQ